MYIGIYSLMFYMVFEDVHLHLEVCCGLTISGN